MSINKSSLSKSLIFFCLALLFGSCGKDPAFKYRVDENGGYKSYNKLYEVKSLVGGAADIFWVIDNSGSMSTYQQSVIANTGIFMNKFTSLAQGMDWRMGMISTSVNEPPYVGFDPNDKLDFTTPNPVAKFQFSVGQLGTSGDSTERSFQPIMNTLRSFPNFIRSKAKLFLIIISDEDEQSNISTQDFVNYLTTLKGQLTNVIAYGIHTTAACGDATVNSTKYREFLQLVGGQVFDICAPDYGQVLGDIGKDIGQRVVTPMIQLTTRPKPSSLHVFYHERDLPSGPTESGGFWIYDYQKNAIIFNSLDFAAGDNENVRVVYLFQD